jgi:integrase
MHLIEPRKGKRKYDIRITNHDGRVVKISGDEDPAVALRIGQRVEMLIKAKQNGDPPPKELQSWIDNMSTSLSNRLVELGLIERRRFERNKPISELIEQYGSIVASRKSNKRKHGRHQEGRVRIACAALKVKQFSDLSGDALLKYLSEREMATSTKRGYIIVMKDFAKQMVRLGVAKENPFAHIKAPGQYEDPEYERQPMTIAQFQKLMEHLDTFERYFGQKAPWTAHDRKLVYWTAAKTAYRQKELRALRVCDLYLDEQPPVICMKARHAKNKTAGEVPIDDDLAEELKVHVAKLEPTDRVFKLPATSGSIVDIMRRDLEGAGIVWKLATGEIIDFHTLRSTCITWWLDVDKLSPKKVQVLARLKTLALVYNYSRNLRIGDFGWLNQGPKLVLKGKTKRAG